MVGWLLLFVVRRSLLVACYLLLVVCVSYWGVGGEFVADVVCRCLFFEGRRVSFVGWGVMCVVFVHCLLPIACLLLFLMCLSL